MTILIERDGGEAAGKRHVGTRIIAHERAAERRRVLQEFRVGGVAVGAAHPGRAVDEVHIVAVKGHIGGHGRTPDAVMEKEDAAAPSKENLLDWAGVKLAANRFRQIEAAAMT